MIREAMPYRLYFPRLETVTEFNERHAADDRPADMIGAWE
jgi:hypothetical protein